MTMVLSLSRWIGKVAIVTGASEGIGEEIARKLVKEGLKVVGVARRVELIETNAKHLDKEKGKLYPLKCDVTKEDDILKTYEWVKTHLGPVHVLVNNAGIVEHTNLVDGNIKKWKNVFDTNVLGLCVATREAVKDMRENNVAGHIIHINSIGGHTVPYFSFTNVYPASKFAVTALTETLRKELITIKSNIKVTSISPGAVKTNIVKKTKDVNSINTFNNFVALQVEDVADAVIYALSTGPNVQVHEIMIKPLHEQF